jgi:ADP-dependent NAD(P)H-hydrate dehydratase / NAD(P)H-hydrate epimerase
VASNYLQADPGTGLFTHSSLLKKTVKPHSFPECGFSAFELRALSWQLDSSMQKVLTAAEMREVDRFTTEKYGIPSIILMENAAHAVADVIAEKLGGSVKGKSVVILCGKGNNGGDGAALARVLGLKGANVDVLLLGKASETTGDARINFGVLSQEEDRAGDGAFVSDFAQLIEIECQEEWEDVHYRQDELPDVVVDAVFGTGLSRPLDVWVGNIIHKLNFAKGNPLGNGLYISVDLPSGLNADSGIPLSEPFNADTTVTFTAPKPANVLPGAVSFNGELLVREIGSPSHLIEEQLSMLYLAERYDVSEWLEQTKFSSSSYKNKRGHALLIAGSGNYSGAAVLCGNAAIRSGAGLVTIGTPRSSRDSIAGRVVPEVMVRSLAETEGGAVSEAAIEEVEGLLKNVDSIAIGSGLSADESTRKFVRHFVENRTIPTILDADALTLLSPFAERPPEGGAPSLILTPHQGEFLRLLGTDDKDAVKDRVAAVREFAQKHRVILVLKGERVLIGEPGGKVVVNPTGNSGLGKAGNGDTLTGIIAGFAAQAAAMNVDIFETVVAAVYIAGLAGDIAEKKFGKRVMTASDVRECLVEAFESVA